MAGNTPLIIAGSAAIGIFVMSQDDGEPMQSIPPVTQGPATAPTPYASPPYAKPQTAAEIAANRAAVKVGTKPVNPMAETPLGKLFTKVATKTVIGGGKKPAGGVDILSGTLTKEQIKNLTNEKVKELEKRASDEYKKLGDKAKVAGAEYLNETYGIQPPLTGKESWKDASKIIGGVAGAAAGGAVCAPIGLSAVCGPLGAMLGAYLGPKVGKWLSDTWDDVEDWAGDLYGDVKGGLKKVIPFW